MSRARLWTVSYRRVRSFSRALHHDPVEVAAEQLAQRGRLDLTVPGDFADRLAQRAQSLRRRWRVALADHAADLVVAAAAQRLGVKGGCADEQFVEQHAQRIDVAAGIDIGVAERGLLGAHVLGRADQLAVFGKVRLLGQPLLGRLGDAKVDDLGDRFAILLGDQHVGRLEVPVDDPLLMGMLDRLADVDEDPQSLAGRQLVLVAVLRDRDAPHVIHHEVGSAALGRPGVEDLGDVRVVHQRQRLPLGLEAGDHLLGVHAQLDDLQRHLAADRLLLLGHVDVAQAAFADLLQELVGADHRAGLFGDGQTRSSGQLPAAETPRNLGSVSRALRSRLVNPLAQLPDPRRTPAASTLRASSSDADAQRDPKDRQFTEGTVAIEITLGRLTDSGPL